jgi:ferric-dicitrate binding protein FerR (iron transport regulator)
VPGEVGGEHADEHVRADAAGEAVVDGSQVQIDGFEAAELRFDQAQSLVGLDDGNVN